MPLINATSLYCQQTALKAIAYNFVPMVINEPFLYFNGTARPQEHLRLNNAMTGGSRGDRHKSVRHALNFNQTAAVISDTVGDSAYLWTHTDQ